MPTNAQTITAALHALGLPTPKAIAEAQAVLSAALAYEVPDVPDVNRAALDVKAKDVPNLIDTIVDAEIRHLAFQRTRGELIDRLERRVQRAITADADELIAAIAPVYNDAAARFDTAYNRLPANWTNAETLVTAGTEAVAALHACQQELGILEACRRIRQAIPVGLDTPLQIATTYATWDSDLSAIEGVKVAATGSLRFFGNLRLTEGCTGLKMHPTLAEQAAYAATLPRFERKAVKNTKDGFGGVQIQKVPA